MKKMGDIEFVNNDVYYMEVLNNVIVINNNYKGILVLDSELNRIDEIELIEDLIIYTSFKSDNKLLFYCPDNNCLVFVDIDLHVKKIIALNGFEDWRISKLYEWKQEYLILLDYAGRFLKVDLEKEHLMELFSNEKECQSIRKSYNKLKIYPIFKLNVLENKAFINVSDSRISLINYEENITTLKDFEKKQYHDFEEKNGYIVKIGEEMVEITYKNNMEICYVSEQYEFLRGKIMFINKELYLFVLSGNKSNSNHVKIERYKY